MSILSDSEGIDEFGFLPIDNTNEVERWLIKLGKQASQRGSASGAIGTKHKVQEQPIYSATFGLLLSNEFVSSGD